MKRFLILTVLFVAALGVGAQDTLVAFISSDDFVTNILNKPSGATVMTLSSEDEDVTYMFELTTPEDGWWKVIGIWVAEDDEVTPTLAGSDTGEYWIHYSELGLGTRNYGGQSLTLKDAPADDANVVFTTTDELIVMPMDIQGDWVKVKVDGWDIEGWIEAEWLCSNPLTNCC